MSGVLEQVVPEGWALATPSDACQVNPRKPAADALDEDAIVTFVPMAAVDDEYGAITVREERTFGELRPKSYTPFAEGDVLFAKITPCMENGKAAVARGLANGVGFGSTEFHVFRSNGTVLPEYLHRYLRQQSFRDDAKAHMSGSAGQLRVPADYVKQVELPLPPLAEQERIVAKVEALLSRVRSARQRLAVVPDILKRFRQAVLTHACSGKLTEDWRANVDSFSSAADEVAAAVQRRRDEYEAKCRTARANKKKPPTRPANLNPREVNAEGLPEVPDTWTWVYLPDVGYMNRGKSRHRPRNAPHLYGGPYPFIQTGEIARSRGRITEHRQTYSEAGLAQSRLWPANTVAITIAANIANSAILAYDACFPDSVVGVIPDADVALPEYIEFFIRTARHDLELYAPATAQKNINISILKELAVPLPPVDEQREIGRRAEALVALAYSIEQRVQAVIKQANALTQSILAKAFRGELVPTEADLARVEGREYESADQLLLRIREQLAQRPPEKKPRHQWAFQDASGMKDKVIITVKRKLLVVLKEAIDSLSPEELFHQAGCTEDDIDGFYQQLREGIEAGQIVQTPEKPDPNNPAVTLSTNKV